MKNSVRFTILATALAGTGMALAYSRGSADGSTALADRAGPQDETAAMGESGLAMEAGLRAARSAARRPVAGLAGLAITAAGAAMLIRRRRRRAAIRGEEL